MSKWKYGMLSAQERIGLLRDGKKDVLDEEVERTREVVKARRELGLDTEEQEKWLDTVGYNYNVAHAVRVGEEPEKVAKTGYAQLYLGNSDSAKKSTSGITGVAEYKSTTIKGPKYITNAKKKIEKAGELAQKAIEEKYEKRRTELEDAFYGDNPYAREAVLNSGGHDNGGKMAKAYDDLARELGVSLNGTSEMMERELEASRKKYAGLVDTLLNYRKNGAAKESLDTIANVLVKNAALEDGYDHSSITGTKKSAYRSGDTEKVSRDNAAKKAAVDALKKNGRFVTSDNLSAPAADTSVGVSKGTSSETEEASVASDGAKAVASETVSALLKIASGGEIGAAAEILARLGGLGVETARKILSLALGKEEEV